MSVRNGSTRRPLKSLGVVLLLAGLLAALSIFMRTHDGSAQVVVPVVHYPMLVAGVVGLLLLLVTRRSTRREELPLPMWNDSLN